MPGRDFWLGFLGFLAVVAAGCLFATHSPAAERCKASWYGAESGTRTANGERFNPNGFSIALPVHWGRPHGERFRVSYRGHSVIVRHNDVGPAARTHRCADLSRGAARALGLIAAGTGIVSIERIR